MPTSLAATEEMGQLANILCMFVRQATSFRGHNDESDNEKRGMGKNENSDERKVDNKEHYYQRSLTAGQKQTH